MRNLHLGGFVLEPRVWKSQTCSLQWFPRALVNWATNLRTPLESLRDESFFNSPVRCQSSLSRSMQLRRHSRWLYWRPDSVSKRLLECCNREVTVQSRKYSDFVSSYLTEFFLAGNMKVSQYCQTRNSKWTFWNRCWYNLESYWIYRYVLSLQK